jgi:hypothetical protein
LAGSPWDAGFSASTGAAEALARRDALLREIASRHFWALPPTAQAKRISDELARYMSRVWPRTRTETICPHHPGLKADLWELLQLRDAPLSSRQVHRKIRLQCPKVGG